MANTFTEKVQRFLPILDEIYKRNAVTSIIEDSSAIWVGTNKIRLPKIELDGAADYDRNDGYVRGNITVDYGDYELEFDRGRSFQIDWVDNDETGFDAFRIAAQEYVRTKEVPEFDATRIAKIASLAGEGIEKNGSSITSFLEEFDAARIALTNNEVSDEGRIAFVSPFFLAGLRKELEGRGRYQMQSNSEMFNRNVVMVDGVPLVEVPSARLFDTINLLDGETSGQEAGGFAPITGTSKRIHLIYADRNAMKAYMKRYASKVFTPETNIFADAFLIQYRNHHDVIVQDNKAAGIYVLKNATAIA
jgi:hypothetical protein